MVGMCTMKTAGVLMMWSRRIKGPRHHLFPCLAVLQTLCVTGRKQQPVRRQNQRNSRNQLIRGKFGTKEDLLWRPVCSKKECRPILHIQEHVSAQRGTTKAALPPRWTFAAALFSTRDKWDVRSSIQNAFFFCTNSAAVTHFLFFSDRTQRQKASQSQSRNHTAPH